MTEFFEINVMHVYFETHKTHTFFAGLMSSIAGSNIVS